MKPNKMNGIFFHRMKKYPYSLNVSRLWYNNVYKNIVWKGFDIMAAYTPMIQQYLTIKAEYQDAFLFFRLGDFYEMFFEDAVKASQELEITLTSRDGGRKNDSDVWGSIPFSDRIILNSLIEKDIK